MWKIYSQKAIDRLKKEAADEAVANYKFVEENKPQHYFGTIDSVRENCSVMLRFDNPHISVFSIERVEMDTAKERTIVGYVFTGEEAEKIKEWSLYISRNQHNELVRKYSQRADERKNDKDAQN